MGDSEFFVWFAFVVNRNVTNADHLFLFLGCIWKHKEFEEITDNQWNS